MLGCSQRPESENTTAKPNSQLVSRLKIADEESRIMPSQGGIVQGYNSQAAVDVDTMLILATNVSQHTNDKQQLKPILDKIKQLPESLEQPKILLADTGYFTIDNIKACDQQGIEPLIAIRRDSHHLALAERLSLDAPKPDTNDPLAIMRWKLKTQEGKACYAKRKSTVEPVFGIIKQAMGFRQFMLRGLSAVTGEWQLVSIAFNLKRMHILAAAR